MVILAHRCNMLGPNPSTENSLEACSRALNEGFGLEIDLRRDAGGTLYISHDRRADIEGCRLELYEPLFRRYSRAPIAINVKELGYESDLIRLWRTAVFSPESFYFDFELLEPQAPGFSQGVMRGCSEGDLVRLASRLSDRGESLSQSLQIPSDVVWADEFDGPWLTQKHCDAVRRAGKSFVVVSPELHGAGERERLTRWADFKKWKIDGICTDFALSAREFFLR